MIITMTVVKMTREIVVIVVIVVTVIVIVTPMKSKKKVLQSPPVSPSRHLSVVQLILYQ